MNHDPLQQFLNHRTREAFDEVVAAHGPRALQAAYRVLGDRNAAEDAAQNAFVSLLRMKSPPGGLRIPAAFVTTMAVNAARKELRSRGRRRNHEEVAAKERQEAAMQAAFTTVEIAEIRDAVSELPDPLRETVELRYFGSLRLADVALALGVARRTVTARLADARERLRGRLTDARFLPILGALGTDTPDVFPETEVRPEYLKRLSRRGNRITTPRPGTMPKMLGLGAVAAVLAIAVFYLAGATGENAPARPPEPEPGMVATGTAAPATEGVVETAADHEARLGRPGEAPVAENRDANSDPAAASGPTGLKVTVLDEAGALLTSGTVSIGLVDYFPPPEVQLALAPFKKYLKPQHLEDGNPLTITGLPDIVDGMEFSVRVTAEGRPPSEQRRIKLAAGRAVELSVSMLPGASIEVTVTDRVTGKPLVDAAVVSVSELGRRGTNATEAAGTVAPGAAVTDESGNCTITGLRPGDHEIAVSADGYREVGSEGVATGSAVAVSLEPVGLSGSVAVRVTDPAGDAIAGLRVELGVEGEATKRMIRTDGNGRGRFEGVPPGYHSATLNFDDWFELIRTNRWAERESLVMSATAKIEADEEVSTRLGFLVGSGLLTGTVIDPEGEPVEGVEVSLGGLLHREATSDAHGRVVFKDLPDGEYRLSIKSEEGGWDWGLTADLMLASGEARDCRIPLGTATVRGRVLLPDGRTPKGRVMITMLGPAFDMKRTNERGEFEFIGVPPGDYRIGVATREFASPDARITVGAVSPGEPVIVKLLHGGRVLVDFAADDRPALLRAKLTLRTVAGAEMNLDRDESGTHDRMTGALPPGAYTLLIEHGETERRTVKFTIEDGEDRVLRLTR